MTTLSRCFVGMLELMILFFYAADELKDESLGKKKYQSAMSRRDRERARVESSSSRDISCFCFVLNAQCFMLSPFVEYVSSHDDDVGCWKTFSSSLAHTIAILFIQLFLYVRDISSSFNTNNAF